jgi:exopolysaccharide biosynthesis polyprenyl glycosylphosphotransferase
VTLADPHSTPWRRRYALAAAITDVGATIAAVLVYGLLGRAPHGRVLGIGLAVLLLTTVCLMISRAWALDAAGDGAREFVRLLRGFLGCAVAIGLIILAAGLDYGRPWVFAVLPAAAALAVLGRLWLHLDLRRRRRHGHAMAKVLAVGTVAGVTEMIQRTRRVPQHGWRVDGVCTPDGAGPDDTSYVEGVHVVGHLDAVPALARSGQFDVVSVGRAPGWSTSRLRRLAWELEGTGTELAVDPGLMEITGPRLHIANLDGLPLLRLSHPSFGGAARLIKGVVDRVGALVGLLLLSPVLLGIALAVQRDGGPVFFRQRRVGVGGKEFRMIKFRSMVVDAEARLAELQDRNEGFGLMFKMREDPRITRIGAVLRRYSLDELPQLFNVLAGSMSLVGPRPPLPREVEGYANDARRRLLVKPGMTGLWQVSGRSDLSWEETVRLDLRYVENWTMGLDVQILIRTVTAIFRGSGAY